MLDYRKICAADFIIAAVFLDGQPFFNLYLPLSRGLNLQIRNLPLALKGHTGGENVVFRHILSDGRNAVVFAPRSLDVKLEYLIQAIRLVLNVAEKPRVVYIPHNDIQIRILGMVHIVHLSALNKARFITKIRNIPRFGIYNAGFGVKLLHDCGKSFCGLPRFNDLPHHKCLQLLLGQRCAAIQPFIFLLRDQIVFLQHPPKRSHFFADIGG